MQAAIVGRNQNAALTADQEEENRRTIEAERCVNDLSIAEGRRLQAALRVEEQAHGPLPPGIRGQADAIVDERKRRLQDRLAAFRRDSFRRNDVMEQQIRRDSGKTMRRSTEAPRPPILPATPRRHPMSRHHRAVPLLRSGSFARSVHALHRIDARTPFP